MNYLTAPGPQPTLLLSNSIFLPRVPNVRILAYDEYIDPLVGNQVDATIAAEAAKLGQQFSISRVSKSLDVPTRLNKLNYDVFLVYEQPKAPPSELSNVGSLWASSLESFSYVGGVIVMLDGGQGVKEMTQLFTATRLFPVNDEVGLSSGTYLATRVLGDQVATRMTTQFPCQNDSCVFETSLTPDANTTFVITEPAPIIGAPRPVVVHITRIAPQP
jgi:hypothetical protein